MQSTQILNLSTRRRDKLSNCWIHYCLLSINSSHSLLTPITETFSTSLVTTERAGQDISYIKPYMRQRLSARSCQKLNLSSYQTNNPKRCAWENLWCASICKQIYIQPLAITLVRHSQAATENKSTPPNTSAVITKKLRLTTILDDSLWIVYCACK